MGSVREARKSNPHFRMPFGKSKGKKLRHMTRGQLVFAANWPQCFGWIRDLLLLELTERGFGFGEYQDVPIDQVPTHYLEWTTTMVGADGGPGLLPPWDEIVKRELERRG